MISTLHVQHYVHVTSRPFDEVLSALRESTGSVEEGFDTIAAGVAGTDNFVQTFKAREGSSGCMFQLLKF